MTRAADFVGSAADDAAESAPVPRDAASLVLIDREDGEPRFLMGRRSRGHGFMPNVYVFPGGGVEEGDLELGARFPLNPDTSARLGAQTTFNHRCLAALPLAAIRETFEETGLSAGTHATFAEPPANWSAFAELGLLPNVGALVPFARAITPPHHKTRYDARFFVAERSALDEERSLGLVESDELEDLGWFAISEIERLPLAQITQRILSEIQDRMERATLFDPREPIPFFRVENGISKIDNI